MNASLDSDLLGVKPKEKWKAVDKLGLYIGGISLVVGTLLLLAFLITKENQLLYTGMIYLAITFFANLIFFLILIFIFIIEKPRAISHLKTAGIMLINIPIAYGYFVIVAMAN